MYPIICRLLGPFNINTYGVFIALGLLVFLYFAGKNKIAKKYLTTNQIHKLLINNVIVAIIGGRILHLITEWHNYDSFIEMFYIWNGGLSSLGAVIAVSLYLPYELYKLRVPILPILDVAGIYVPLFHSIARMGCFFAGCCFGAASTLPWSVCYNNAECLAPLNVNLHPTQIYSSIALFFIFLIMKYTSEHYYKFAGQLALSYLILTTTERFFMDFLRGDRNLSQYGLLSVLSIDQIIALCIFALSLVSLIYILLNKSHTKNKNL